MKPTSIHGSEKYCVFLQGTSWFAMPALSVQEVCARPEMVPVPYSDPVLAGLCHVRNEFLPVLRLRVLAGEDAGPEQQLLVLAGAKGNWGLLVDKVAGLEVLELSLGPDVQDAGGWTAAVLGSASCRDRVVQVLDPAGVYRLAETVLQRSWFQTLEVV